MNCPACGHVSPDRTKFCLECGKPLAPCCAGCGAELPLAAKFCGECGSPTGDGAAAAAAIEAALHEAGRLIGEAGAHVYDPTVHEERARLAALRGDASGRERELRAALHLYTERGATAHAERLEQEMER